MLPHMKKATAKTNERIPGIMYRRMMVVMGQSSYLHFTPKNNREAQIFPDGTDIRPK